MQNIVSEVVLEIGEETEEIEIIYEIIKRCRVVMCFLIQKTRGRATCLFDFDLHEAGLVVIVPGLRCISLTCFLPWCVFFS